jgi:Lrp/AsnC family leucine-responsive transcriptional regulator
MSTSNNEDIEKLLDNVGWQILYELQENARIPFTELGRRVGLSSPAVAERVRRMEEAGIIVGYRAEVNLAAVGLGMMAIITIRKQGARSHDLEDRARAMSEVLACHKVTGAECYYMRVAVRSVEHLDKVIEAFSLYGQVVTSVVLNSPVKRRTITSDLVE